MDRSLPSTSGSWILYKIFDYLDPLVLHREVSLVCKLFNSMIMYEYMWKKIYLTRNRLPVTTPIPLYEHLGLYSDTWRSGELVRWRELCVSVERTRVGLRRPHLHEFHIPGAIIDAVHCMGGPTGFCLTGSRERTLRVWNLNTGRESHHVVLAHRGWLSGLDSFDDRIVSAGWDNCLKTWALRENLQPLSSFEFELALMGLRCRRHLIAACSFPKLYLIDPRINRADGVFTHGALDGLIQLDFWNNNYLIISSRSRKLVLFDLRMLRPAVIETIPVASAPSSMDLLDDVVYIGDFAGRVTVYDPHNNFRLIDEYVVSDVHATVRVVIARRGHFIAGMSDGSLQVVTSAKRDDKVQDIASQRLTSEVIAGHQAQGVCALACALNGEGQVLSWFL